MEELTDRFEAEAERIIGEIEELGGMVPCIENGTIQLWIADRAYEDQRRLESGDRVLVGVNKYRREEAPPSVELYEVDADELAAQIERVRRVRSERDPQRAEGALARLREAATGTENLMPYLVECSRAYCTLGEMVAVLRGVFGVFREPAVISLRHRRPVGKKKKFFKPDLIRPAAVSSRRLPGCRAEFAHNRRRR